MTRQEIFDKTIGIVRDSVPETGDMEFDESTVINTDAGIDSMGFTLIMCRIEAAFSIKIPQRKWEKLYTVGDVIDIIEKYSAR